jgi:hypothetical protein
MRNVTSIRSAQSGLSLTAAAVCLALTAGPASAQVASEYNISLSEFLSRNDLTSGELGNTISLSLQTDVQWATGVNGNLKPAYFSLAPINQGPSPINRALRFSYNPIYIQPLTMESCSVDGECQQLSATESGLSLTFSHEGTAWEVRSPGSPCKDTYTCTFSVPAWSLEARRRGGYQGWKSFPATATILDQSQGVTIFDARTGSEWTTFPFKNTNGPAGNLGRLHFAELFENGALVLSYEKGQIYMDFVTDRLFAVTPGGVSLANESLGLAQDKNANLSWRELPFVSGSGRVIAVSQNIIVWSDRAVTWSPRSGNSSKIAGTIVELPATPSLGAVNVTAEGQIVDLLSTGTNRVTQYRYRPFVKSFEEITTETIDAGEEYTLYGGVMTVKGQSRSCSGALKNMCEAGVWINDAGWYSSGSMISDGQIKVSFLKH